MGNTGRRISATHLLVAAAATPVAMWWLERLVAIRNESWFTGSSTFNVGSDFRTFHTAARLVVDGQAEILYEATSFQAASGPGVDYGAFFYTAPLAVLVAPLGWLSFETAWVVWSMLSVAAVALGSRLLGTKCSVRLALGALLFTPFYITIMYGQASGLWLLIFAAVYACLRTERNIAAGMVAGLLILKPTMAIGIMLWWLVDWKRYRASAIAAVGSAVGALLLAELMLPGSLSGYTASTWDFLASGEPGAQWAQYSMWTFWDLLVVGRSWLTAIAGAVTVVALIVVFARHVRAQPGLDLVFASVVVVTVLVSPYILAYDWTLLLIPAVLLRHGGRIPSTQLMVGGALVAIASTWSIVLAIEFLDSPGYTLQFAPLVLIGVGWWVGRLLNESMGEPAGPAQMKLSEPS